MLTNRKIEKAIMGIVSDPRVTVWHICLYIAILHHWHEGNFEISFSISRRKLMAIAHIGSIATYHKCVKQLVEYGYIEYFPSYHPTIGTTISLKFEGED